MLKLSISLWIAFGVLAADTVTYKYDDSGRLTSATYGNGAVVTYTYDKAGNLLSRSVPGAAPTISSGGVVNAATYTSPLVHGELATLFGTNLASGAFTAGSLPLSTTLGGSQITVGGIPAPLYYVSPTQINFQVPFGVSITGTAPVIVTQSGVPSKFEGVALAEYAPGIFGYARTATIVDPIVIHFADNSLVTPGNPAAAGEVLVIYATGAGSFDNTPADGAGAPSSPLASTKIQATVTVGGSPAQVFFSGLTPGFVGLIQINIQLPATLPAGGTLPLVVSFGSSATPPANLYVH
jgi:uncharacterized protein (TIGR03437 family)